MSDNVAFSLKAVGDICPGDKSILGLGVCSLMKKHGPDYPLKNVNNLFRETDIVIGNLEGLLSQRMAGAGEPTITFCGLPEFASELKKTGFNVINIANNHILEHGTELFEETVDILNKAGLNVCGLRDTEEYYSKPVFVEKENKRVGILGYNWVGKDKFSDADHYIAQSHDSVVNYTWNRDKSIDKENQEKVYSKNQNVINDIKRLRAEADYIVLMPHWGYEFVDYPPYGVTLEAHSFIDAGVDLILGVHPHVLQGMEQYRGKWVFYSLGNFIFDIRLKKTINSVMLNYDFHDDGKDAFALDYLRLNNHFQPTRLDDGQSKSISRVIEKSVKRIIAADKEKQLDDDKVYKEFEKKYYLRKLSSIYHHFKAIPGNPIVIKIIARKIMGFFELLRLRTQGNKIRW